MAQPVKLRLIVADSGGEQSPKSCYNETLHEDCEWAQWQQRMACKLGGSPSFRFVPPVCCSSGPEEGSLGETLSLSCDEDLRALRKLYASALKEQAASSAKTFRICVIATPGQQHNQQGEGAKQQQCGHGPSNATGSNSAASAGAPVPASATSHAWDAALRVQPRSVRRHLGHMQDMQLAGPLVARPDVFWDTVLRSIVDAIDRHSVGRQLSASACAPSSQVEPRAGVHAVML